MNPIESNGTLQQVNLAGSFTLPGTSMTVNRMGYGAMQLAGRDGDKLVWGPPRDVDGAIAVLREAVASGVNHIDTADFYGPHVTNQIIRKALSPYPDDLVIVTKVGARRGEDGSWIPALSREELTAAVHDNLRNLGLDVLDVVNLRSMLSIHEPAEGSIEEPMTRARRAPTTGLIRHIGLSNVTPTQIAEARPITPIVCVQNIYNLAQGTDDAFIDDLARKASPMCRSFHSAGSPRCSRLPCRTSPRASRPHPCRLRLPGFFSARRTSW